MRLHLLGTSAAAPDAAHDTVGLALELGPALYLVEAGGSLLHRLARQGLDPGRLRGIFVSHDHPDHLYGLPGLVLGLYVLGFRRRLPVYGPPQATETARRLLEAFRWHEWGDGAMLAVVDFVPLDPAGGAQALDGELTLRWAPADHGRLQALAYRFEAGGKALVYSGDTAPCRSVEALARGADLLVHECTGLTEEETLPHGHSPAPAVGELAARAQVKGLILVHLPVLRHPPERLTAAAEARFGGRVWAGQDGAVWEV